MAAGQEARPPSYASTGETPEPFLVCEGMSGHSKWSSIKHKKAATDARRGQLFTKLARAISVAAREGGGDPESNFTLAAAIQKARDYSMPKDSIQRAIDRGTGAGGDADAIERVLYEGYGPAGVAVLVEALTDNRNRTSAEMRHAFDKHGGSLGEPGSVAWVFEKRGVVMVDGDMPLLLKEKRDAAGLTQVACVAGEDLPDLAHGPVLVVGHDLGQDGYPARSVPLVGDLLVGDPLQLARALLDGALDVVGWHVHRLGSQDGGPQTRVSRLVPSPHAGGHRHLTDELREDPAALRIHLGLLVLDAGPLAVS